MKFAAQPADTLTYKLNEYSYIICPICYLHYLLFIPLSMKPELKKVYCEKWVAYWYIGFVETLIEC